jgi:quinol monooxygenase YgiN
MLIVIGQASPRSGRRQDLLDAVAEMARVTRSDEGCELYGFYADVTDPDVILSLEIWHDQAALDAPLAHDHTRSFIQTVPELVSGTPVLSFFHAEPAKESNL